jgi:predicted RNA-binding Zn ribbon-like protein
MTTIKREEIAEPDQEEALFVAFANTLEYTRGEPDEKLPDIDALLDWLRERGLISARARAAEASRLRRDREEADRRLGRFRHLRALLQAVSHDLAERGEPDPERVIDLNHILRHGLHYHQLRQQPGGTRYEVAQIGDRLDQARATIASSFAHFLAEDTPDRLRICANEGCQYIFIDRSPTGRRRWCDMRTCGNQAKVAAHRARARAQTAGAGDPPRVPPAGASV